MASIALFVIALYSYGPYVRVLYSYGPIGLCPIELWPYIVTADTVTAKIVMAHLVIALRCRHDPRELGLYSYGPI